MPFPALRLSAPSDYVRAPLAPTLSILKVPLPPKVSDVAVSEPVCRFNVSVPRLIVVPPV